MRMLGNWIKERINGSRFDILNRKKFLIQFFTPATSNLTFYFLTSINSTSNLKVAPGAIFGGAPRSP